MPHVTSSADIAAPASVGVPDKIGQHLTESILTLQQMIRNIREDVSGGTSPSILLPAESGEGLESGMVMLSLEPSASDIELHLAPLERRLQDLEHTTRACSQWLPPAAPPKSPEYSIIDISDLLAAVKLLEDISEHTNSRKSPTPQQFFSKYKWMWDPLWKEFYTMIPDQSSYVYLSRWKLNEQRQVWEHVSMIAPDVKPDFAAEMLGSWEDWAWDPVWKEWYLDVTHEEGEAGRCCVYASRWDVQDGGEWVYAGRFAA
ncbi:hypothetical protein BKA63DRAFT_297145 [Paraphoma chrysanthemicola]|nr:hypothetical protein BKA63DRAFT_297145 [Paraphoma chrysanthemicola]